MVKWRIDSFEQSFRESLTKVGPALIANLTAYRLLWASLIFFRFSPPAKNFQNWIELVMIKSNIDIF